MRSNELLRVFIGINIGIHITNIVLGNIAYGIIVILISLYLLKLVEDIDNCGGKWIKIRKQWNKQA